MLDSMYPAHPTKVGRLQVTASSADEHNRPPSLIFQPDAVGDPAELLLGAVRAARVVNAEEPGAWAVFKTHQALPVPVGADASTEFLQIGAQDVRLANLFHQ